MVECCVIFFRHGCSWALRRKRWSRSRAGSTDDAALAALLSPVLPHRFQNTHVHGVFLSVVSPSCNHTAHAFLQLGKVFPCGQIQFVPVCVRGVRRERTRYLGHAWPACLTFSLSRRCLSRKATTQLIHQQQRERSAERSEVFHWSLYVRMYHDIKLISNIARGTFHSSNL